jgi:hypothetical protein
VVLISILIRLAGSPQERRRALAFVRRNVRRRFGGIPPPSEILFFAEKDSRICGTIALDFAGDAGRFHLEEIYRFDYARMPWVVNRGMIAQFGKWWAKQPGIAVRLMHSAHVHVLARGKSFGLAEAKPRIVRRVEEFGMQLVKVPGATLQVHGMSSRGEGYYATLPFPELYMFDLRTNLVALSRYIKAQEQG